MFLNLPVPPPYSVYLHLDYNILELDARLLTTVPGAPFPQRAAAGTFRSRPVPIRVLFSCRARMIPPGFFPHPRAGVPAKHLHIL